MVLGCASGRTLTPAQAMKEVCEERAVPMQVVGGRDHVDVDVAGKRLRLQVDTGGNALGIVVYRSALQRVGVGDPASLPRAFEVGGRRIELPEAAHWAALDDVSDEAKASPVHPFKVRKTESDGQIGAGFLSHFLVCLDASRGRLGLLPKDGVRVRGEGGVPLALFPDPHTGALYPLVRTELGALLVDSGPPVGFLENEKVPKGAAVEPLACGDADTITGSFRKERMAALDLATFGPAIFATRDDGTFVSLFGRRRDVEPVGAIGNDVLRRHRVLLDYGGATMFFEAVAPPDTALRAPRVCVSLAYDEKGCPTVTRTDGASELRVGDVLLREGERDLCAMTSADVLRALAGDDEKRLTVRRQEATLLVVTKGRSVLAR